MPQIGRLNRILCIFGEMLLFLKICPVSLTLTLYGQLYAYLLEKWNVMLIVKPFYLINLIRLITLLDFQNNDIMSLTRDGRGWVGHL